MALVRMIATTKVTLSHTFYADEVPTDAAGAVTATVKRLDGTDAGSGTATHTTTGTYTRDITGASLDTFTVDWSGSVGGSNVVVRDFVELVGGFFFGTGEYRDEFKPAATWTATKLAQKRTEVEIECERICRRAFVPRFKRYLLDGSGDNDLVVPDMFLRTVRAASVADGPAGPFVALTSTQLAALAALDSGIITRTDDVWPAGRRNVIVEIEHGMDYPPEDIRSSSKLRLRSILPRPSSGIPDRTLSYTTETGSTYRISLPTAEKTGIPDVDGTYEAYAEPKVWIS
jgi:hypothetical protein